MQNLKYCFLVVFTFFSFTSFAADWVSLPKTQWETAIKKSNAPFAEKTYQIYYTTCTFKDYTTQTIEEEQKGEMLKLGKKFRSQSMGMNTFQDDTLQWIVSGEEKLIMLTRPTSVLDKMLTQQMDQKSLDIIKDVQEKTTEKGYQIRIIYTEKFRYHSYECFMDLDKKKVLKTILFFNEEVKHNPLDVKSIKTKPRVEITYTGWNFAPKTNQEEINVLNYFSRTKKGAFVPTAAYLGYRIADSRLNIKKGK